MNKKTIIIMLLCFVFVIVAGVGAGFLAGNVLRSRPVKETTEVNITEENTGNEATAEDSTSGKEIIVSGQVSDDGNVPAEDTALSEEEIYEAYWADGGYENLNIFSGKESFDGIEIESVFADIDKDGIKELLLAIADKNAQNIRGCVQEQALLDIIDGVVTVVFEKSDTGASTGGLSLILKYDTVTSDYVLMENEFSRFGALHNSSKYIVYSSENDFLSPSVEFVEIFTGDSMEIDVIKRKTSLYSESESGLTYYMHNENYISEEAYEELKNSYIDPTDPDYILKPVSFDNIIN